MKIAVAIYTETCSETDKLLFRTVALQENSANRVDRLKLQHQVHLRNTLLEAIQTFTHFSYI